MNRFEFYVFPRSQKLLTIRPDIIERFSSAEDVPEDADLIVVSGRINRVPTFLVGRVDKAVNERFMRRHNLRWDKSDNRWVNGQVTAGKIVISV